MKPPENALKKHLLQLNIGTFFAEFPAGPQLATAVIPGILSGAISCGSLLLRPLEQILSRELSTVCFNGSGISVASFATAISALSVVTEVIGACKRCKDAVCGCSSTNGSSSYGSTQESPRFLTRLRGHKPGKKGSAEPVHESTEILDLVVKNINALCSTLSPELCNTTLHFLCTCLSDCSPGVLISYGERILDSGVLKTVLSPESRGLPPQTRELGLGLIEALMRGFRPTIVTGSSEGLTTDKRSLLDDVVFVLGAESFGPLAEIRPVRLRAVHMFLHIVVESNAALEQDGADSLPVVSATITQHNCQQQGSGGGMANLRVHQCFTANSEYLVKGVCALLEHELNNAFSEGGTGDKEALEIIQVTSSLMSCFQSDLFPSIDDVGETPGIISKLKKFAAISSNIGLNMSASKLERLTSTQFSQTQQ